MDIFGIIFCGFTISVLLLFLIVVISAEIGEGTALVVSFILAVCLASLLLFFLGEWVEMLNKYSNFERQLAHVIEAPLIGEKKTRVIVDVVYSDGRLSSESLVSLVNSTACR